jgi:hypothetical protein
VRPRTARLGPADGGAISFSVAIFFWCCGESVQGQAEFEECALLRWRLRKALKDRDTHTFGTITHGAGTAEPGGAFVLHRQTNLLGGCLLPRVETSLLL